MIRLHVFASALIVTLAALPAAAAEPDKKPDQSIREGGMSVPARPHRSESAEDAMRRYIIELRNPRKQAPDENMDHVVGEELC